MGVKEEEEAFEVILHKRRRIILFRCFAPFRIFLVNRARNERGALLAFPSSILSRSISSAENVAFDGIDAFISGIEV